MNPGIYTDLSNSAYHAETEYVSSSYLKSWLPEWFKPFTGSPDVLNFGTAFHTMVLGVGEPVVPVAASSTRTQAFIRERDAVAADGGVAVLESDMETLEGMRKAVEGHPHAAELLFHTDGDNELSVFTTDYQKARLDRHIPGRAIDLKTTSARPGRDSLARAVIDFGYDVQAAHYMSVCEQAQLPVEEFTLIFVSKIKPYPVSVVTLSESFLERGHTLRDLALSRCLSDGLVEPYEGARNVLTLHPPRWAQLERTEAF